MKRSRFTLLFLGSLLVAPAAWGSFAGTEVFLPSVGKGPGVGDSQWDTVVWVHNPNQSTVAVQLHYLRRDQPNQTPVATYSGEIPAGDTIRVVDAMQTLFGVEGFGAIRVVADGPLIVNSRIFNVPGGALEAESTGQFFAAVPASFAISAGQSATVLGVYQTHPRPASEYRYNFGFVEAAGSNVTVRVTALDSNGAELSFHDYALGPYEPRQYNIDDLVPQCNSENLRLQLEVLSGNGAVIGFGSGIANQSDDPSTFEMQYRDALLEGGGLSEVHHDSSLTGAGTQEEPLGIADNAVNMGKLAAPPGAAGQVLATDGAGLMWQDDGLTLPFEGDLISGTWLVNLTNHGGPLMRLRHTGTDSAPALIVEHEDGTSEALRVFHYGPSGSAAWLYTGHLDNPQPALKVRSASRQNETAAIFADTLTQEDVETFGVWGSVQSGGGAGVKGVSHSDTNAHGVYGLTSAGWGWASGVFGRASHAQAIGTTGWHEGPGWGVLAYSEEGIGLVVKNKEADLIRAYDEDPVQAIRLQLTNGGDLHIFGELYPGGGDFAELLPAADDALAPGDVLAIDDDGALIRSSEPYQRTVVGVYSTKPGVVGDASRGSPGADRVPLAIVGIVPVAVCDEAGPIRPGDLLTTSSEPGVAMTARRFVPGTVIGKALDAHDSGEGEIDVLLMPR